MGGLTAELRHYTSVIVESAQEVAQSSSIKLGNISLLRNWVLWTNIVYRLDFYM